MAETYAQKYYRENKEELKKYLDVKVYCECGKKVIRKGMSQHKKTKIHENRIMQERFKKVNE